MTNPYDYGLTCAALESLIPGQPPIVTHWSGSEAVSRLYRFEVTFALRKADLALEQLLNQAAAFNVHKPDGSLLRWHGIVTQVAQQGSDETYHFYQIVLEPRMARLRALRWSDVYLDVQLDDLIRQLLRLADLDEPYAGPNTVYDYRIAASQLARTRTAFTCQFEESCLDFLQRKLEFYGVYFWFEQGDGRESVIFANNVDQQPTDADHAVYYPKGAIDPDALEVALTRLNRRVSLHPSRVTLHDSNDLGNTALSLISTAGVPAPAVGFGEVHLTEDHFEKLDDETTVAGRTIATWRAEELSCKRLRVEGEARTPGVVVGRIMQVSEYLRGADTAEYYVTEISHEGTQTLKTAPETDAPAYIARFAALPRWLDTPEGARQPLQYRPSRTTPIPVVSRLVNGFVDVATPNQPMQYAQPDDDGRYKVRFAFPRQRYSGNQNSAWLRMATPYAGGAATSGVGGAGMHFPLREGTEVLIAFLNGNPDRPVIMAALPNVEAPSVVNARNSADHVIRTPGGNVLAMSDATQSSSSGEEAPPQGQPGVYVGTTTADTSLNLGAPHDDSMAPGFNLTTAAVGNLYAETGMSIEVPGHLKIGAGTKAPAGFLQSVATNLPSGISAVAQAGIVMQNFFGIRAVAVEGLSLANFLGLKVDTMEGGAYTVTLGLGKQIHLLQKKVVNPRSNYVTAALSWVAGQWKNVLLEKEEKAGSFDTTALTKYTLTTPLYELQAGGSTLSINAVNARLRSEAIALSGFASASLRAPAVSISGDTTCNLKAARLALDADIASIESQNLTLNGAALTVSGGLIRVG